MSNVAELTAKQARFVSEYLVDGNGAGAAVRAGYSAAGAHVTASRMLRNATPVARAIEARQAADATRLSLRREDVLAGLLEAVDQARAQSNPMGMIAGFRELARLLGFYAPEIRKVALTSKQGALHRNLSAMSDAQLLALIEQGAAATTSHQ